MRTYLPEFDLRVTNNLAEAAALLAEGNWRPLAGGTDLMVLLNAGRMPGPKQLLSIKSIPELRKITVRHESVHIGAAVSFRQIREHPLLQQELPLLCQAASWAGGIANQNQATIGGNIANASPAADSSPPLLVHDAIIRLVSAAGERLVPYTEFHLGYKQLQLRPEELIYQIELPRPTKSWRYIGRKVGTRRAQAISKCSFALGLQGDGSLVDDVRLAVGSVAPIPKRCVKTEALLRGQRLDSDIIAAACEALRGEISPIDDIRSTAAYRSAVTVNLLRQSLVNARDNR